MTANSTYSTYAPHSPLKHRISFSNTSTYNPKDNTEEAETLEEEEIWPIMEVMSQEAIEEMVEKTFLMAGEHAIQSGRISFEEFFQIVFDENFLKDEEKFLKSNKKKYNFYKYNFQDLYPQSYAKTIFGYFSALNPLSAISKVKNICREEKNLKKV